MKEALSNKILSVLENFTLNNSDDIATDIAGDMRRRRVEKNITRDKLAMMSGVSASNIARFEQKGLISLKNLIQLAVALGYASEIRGIFAQPKYDTMEELAEIRKNNKKKRAYGNEED